MMCQRGLMVPPKIFQRSRATSAFHGDVPNLVTTGIMFRLTKKPFWWRGVTYQCFTTKDEDVVTCMDTVTSRLINVPA